EEPPHHPRHRREDRLLHLHRLDDDEGLPGAHGVALDDLDEDDGAGHRRLCRNHLATAAGPPALPPPRATVSSCFSTRSMRCRSSAWPFCRLAMPSSFFKFTW